MVARHEHVNRAEIQRRAEVLDDSTRIVRPRSDTANKPSTAATKSIPPWSYTFRMPRGNPSPKLAITVDPDVHDRIIAAAAHEGVSVSAWMTEAARRALLVGDGLSAVAEWERINGHLTAEEMARARQRVATELADSRGQSA